MKRPKREMQPRTGLAPSTEYVEPGHTRDTRETLDHDYADAQRRGHPVTLLVTETTGALSPTFDRALRALGKHARAPTTHDSTRYGLSRSSPRTFLAHHRAAISAAVVLADATTISLAAPAMSFKLTMGMSPF